MRTLLVCVTIISENVRFFVETLLHPDYCIACPGMSRNARVCNVDSDCFAGSTCAYMGGAIGTKVCMTSRFGGSGT